MSARITEAMVKRATQEFLSHRGERPERIKRGGYALWEENAPAMRAALAAALSTGEAEGMVLVPREITAEMAHALESNIAECSAPSDVHRANWADAYRAMLAAAPTSEGSHHG